MKLSNAGCAILAPALSIAAALAMPEPTQPFAVAVDNWSPAPTSGPPFNLFGREAEQPNASNTCGYASGLSGTHLQPHGDLQLNSAASPIACPTSQICATNTYYGVHGCCSPDNLSSCTIATTCIPNSAISASCTNAACSTNNAIAKCTASSAQECYMYLFDYGSATLTQNGCTSSGFTSTIPRTYGPTSTPVIVITVTASPVNTPTSSPSSTGNATGEKKQSLGPIVGGTIGGCTILSLVALAAFLIHRRRLKLKEQHTAAYPAPTSQFQHGTSTFDPIGYTEQDIKTWQQTGALHRPSLGAQGYVGVSEVHGDDRAVEVEAPEKTKIDHWHTPGQMPVEVEAPAGAEMIAFRDESTAQRDEEKRWWRAPAEAP